MTKRRLNLRNVVAIAICLAGITMFSGCDKEPDPVNTGTEQEANIVAFTFTGIDGSASIDKSTRTVTAKAKATTDLTAIKAEFTLSLNATATVNGVTQVSKQTANNFTSPVTYSVTSGDGKTIEEWVVTITKKSDIGEMAENFSMTKVTWGESDGVGGSYTIQCIRTADGCYERRTGEAEGLMQAWIILHPEEDLSTYYSLCTGQPLYTETYTLWDGKLKGLEWALDITERLPTNPPPVRIGDETFLGRNCAKFVYEVNMYSVTSKEEYWVDKETGAVLKYTLDFLNEAGYVKGSRIATEYIVGGATLPPHP